MNLCVDCKWARYDTRHQGDTMFLYCCQPTAIEHLGSPVDGSPPYSGRVRYLEELCGRQGKWWEDAGNSAAIEAREREPDNELG